MPAVQDQELQQLNAGVAGVHTPPSDAASPESASSTSAPSLRRWIKIRVTRAVDLAVSHRDAVVVLTQDTCEVLGVGEEAANSIKSSTPWVLRMFSHYSPDYHLAKGSTYLETALDLIRTHGEHMPEKVENELSNKHVKCALLHI